MARAAFRSEEEFNRKGEEGEKEEKNLTTKGTKDTKKEKKKGRMTHVSFILSSSPLRALCVLEPVVPCG
ncbi:hypothetical protein AGMMS49587_05640 [Spirochaetia bacterium]|nr:hypothetical protein AGMMS49587_05640 [Spirochaetia bacterium]